MGRLVLADYLNNNNTSDEEHPLAKFKGMTLQATLEDAAVMRDVEKQAVACSAATYAEKVLILVGRYAFLKNPDGPLLTLTRKSCSQSILPSWLI